MEMKTENQNETVVEPVADQTSAARPYTGDEVAKLDRILEMVRNGASSEQMGHWGNHSDYSKGW